MRVVRHLLDIDAAKEIARIAAWIRETTLKRFGKKGAIVAISGGIDSSVVAALCVRALGPERVLGCCCRSGSSDDTRA